MWFSSPDILLLRKHVQSTSTLHYCSFRGAVRRAGTYFWALLRPRSFLPSMAVRTEIAHEEVDDVPSQFHDVIRNTINIDISASVLTGFTSREWSHMRTNSFTFLMNAFYEINAICGKKKVYTLEFWSFYGDHSFLNEINLGRLDDYNGLRSFYFQTSSYVSFSIHIST